MNGAFRIIVAMAICCRLEIYKTFTTYEQIMEYVWVENALNVRNISSCLRCWCLYLFWNIVAAMFLPLIWKDCFLECFSYHADNFHHHKHCLKIKLKVSKKSKNYQQVATLPLYDVISQKRDMIKNVQEVVSVEKNFSKFTFLLCLKLPI